MRETVFVVSDLHLGGAPPREGRPGFQMCSLPGQERLAAFFRWVPTQRDKDRSAHVVIAGDIVDFLAEEAFVPFSEEKLALEKLGRILEQTADIWKAVGEAAADGVRFTFLLGNHDIELSLPRVRRRFIETLETHGRGTYDFLYDNEAFVRGTLIVEHGNRYDGWNAVPHNQLRRARSALSRKEHVPPISPPAGSMLVANVMNALKKEHPFIDLLKPEKAALLPLLAVLQPVKLRDIQKAVEAYFESRKVRYDGDGIPIDADFITSATLPAPQVPQDDEALDTDRKLALANELATEPAADADDMGGQSGIRKTVKAFIDVFRAMGTSSKQKELRRLHRALIAFADESAFDVSREDEAYMKPVRRLKAAGFRVIVFGHTHLAKRVDLGDGCRYLNTGTWADLMRVPIEVYDTDPTKGLAALEIFAADLLANDTDKHRRRIPTFARIDLNGHDVESADVLVFGSPPAALPGRLLAT